MIVGVLQKTSTITKFPDKFVHGSERPYRAFRGSVPWAHPSPWNL